MSKIFKTAATIVIVVFLAVLGVAAANLQAQPKPTDVTASNTAEGHVLVSWDDDAAPVHRVGWTHDAEFRAAQAAGDWLEAFHFADTKRETDYAIKYLPGGQPYWIIVGAANERFGGATWSDWTSLTTAASANPDPDPAVPGQGAAADCTDDDYDRAEWGEYPAPDPQATPTWTKPADDVASRDITLDHHVALKDAHISGGCDWSATMKNDFATDPENLNPTTRSFNSSKGSRTPDQLTGIALSIIDTGGEKCDYVTQHDEVKDKYDLTVTADEAATVTEWLSLCTTNTSTTSTPSETASDDSIKQWSEPPSQVIDISAPYTAVLQTSAGSIAVELLASEAPYTVNNFVFLARQGFYESVIFHRTIEGFMIQGGDPTGTGSGGPGYSFADEPVQRPYVRGVMAMANAGPDTNGSQFFIMHADYRLPPYYTIFGQVMAGMETVDAIATAPTQPGGEGSTPVNPVVIQSVEIVGP